MDAYGDRLKILDGTVLKIIALATMIIDHVGAVLYHDVDMFRIIGRMAFPVYCFLLAEGAVHTGNIKKYMLKLAVFAIISEPFFDYALKNKVLEWSHQNVYCTLFLGLTAIYLSERISKNISNTVLLYAAKILVFLAFCLIGQFLKVDYDGEGVAVICIFYELRKMIIPRLALPGFILWNMGGLEVYALMAFLPLALYNGRRSHQPKYMKNLFYLMYPLHFFVLILIRHFFFSA